MSAPFFQIGDYFCSICHGVFKNPVVLVCSHNFCRDCLKQRWSRSLLNLCPLCKKRSPKSDPPCNLALKNLCDTVTLDLSLERKASVRSEARCSLHSEKLKLFCLDHQQPVCVVCRDSRAHTNHRFSPIDEAAEDYKTELRQQLGTLQDHVKHCIRVKLSWDQTVEQIRGQAQTTESHIREKFKKLQYFLLKEEEARISALRKEEEQKTKRMRFKILTLSRQIESLSETIKATEQELLSGSVTFLQEYQATMQTAKQRSLMDVPKMGQGALIDVAKHLGNLTYNIWNKMKEMVTYSPVVLDPNTAGPTLFVFEDLRHFLCVERQNLLPQNPERFEKYPMVLGSEGFDSGTHSWDIEVKNEADWAVGVIEESGSRKDNLSGYWELQYRDGVYKACSSPEVEEYLYVREQLQKIRVKLECSKGTLSFTNLDTDTHIYTFYPSFTERVFPFVNTFHTKPLSILPQGVTVQVGT